MTETVTEALRYPIGKLERKSVLSPEQRRAFIRTIAHAPDQLRAAVAGLTPEQIDTPYRPEGWTVRQVVHHLADSHMNLYIRLKLALTEDTPTIKSYDEARWAELDDSEDAPIDVSVTLFDALQKRCVTVLEAMRPEDFARKLNHPERGILTIDELLSIYEWHGRHHIAHITSLCGRMAWR